MKQKAMLTIDADLRFLDMTGQFVCKMAQLAGMDSKVIPHIELAVDEACTNIIKHGYHNDNSKQFSITCSFDDSIFRIEIEDQGTPFDFDTVAKPDINASLKEREVGGLGIFLMRKIMDKIDYHTTPKGPNVMVMEKRL